MMPREVKINVMVALVSMMSLWKRGAHPLSVHVHI